MAASRAYSYDLVRLAFSGSVTRKQRHDVRDALAKPFCSIPREKLIVLIFGLLSKRKKCRIGRNRDEAIAKLLKLLKEGPLRECESDEERLKEANRFLPSPEGVTWVDSWFLPNDATVDAPHRSQAPRSPTKARPTLPHLDIVPSASRSIPEQADNHPLASPLIAPSVAGPPAIMMAPRAPTPPSATLPSPTTPQRDPMPVLHDEAISSAEQSGHGAPSNERVAYRGTALCLRCWRFHSTDIGGPFLFWFPTRPMRSSDSSDEQEPVGNCQIRRNIVIATILCLLAWAISSSVASSLVYSS